MELEGLSYEIAEQVATITLNRPDRLNAISKPMLSNLSQWLQQCEDDPEVRVIVLTGAGRAFCSGLDLKDQSSPGEVGNEYSSRHKLRAHPPLVLHTMDKPIICAINGPAAGYGLDLALGCDIRLVSTEATLSTTFVRLGIVPASGGTWILPRLIGWERAAELCFTGRVLDANQALELGLVSRVVPPDRLMAETALLAMEIAANAPLAVQACKRVMRLGLEEGFEAAVHRVMMQLRPLAASEDFKEGVKAFQERRKPHFHGR